MSKKVTLAGLSYIEGVNMESESSNSRCLGVFSLVMIAIVSVDSIRNLPIIAQYGLPLVSFFLVAGLAFFLPLTWISSQLAIRYPHAGGSYLWIEAAFGKKFGYLSIWLQWVYNIIWYPTIFAFLSSILATMLAPGLEDNKWFILGSCASLYWIITYIHSKGVKMSGLISTVSTLVGTLFPMALMIGAAVYWLASGSPSAITFSAKDLIPNETTYNNLAYFSNFLFSLLGIEVIAMHAANVKNPTVTYPKALSISAPIILISLMLSSLALCVIVPPEKIGIITGIMDVFDLFFKQYYPGGTFIIGWSIVIGCLGIASSWMIGLARGLHVAFTAINAPKPLQKLNKSGAPVNVLIFQGVVYTILLSAFLLLPGVNSSYWLLSALTAQFALSYYVILFFAAIKLLRSKKHSRIRAFMSTAIPLLAVFISVIGIGVGFLPPDEIGKHHILHYELFMIGSLITFCMIPFLFLRNRTAKSAKTAALSP